MIRWRRTTPARIQFKYDIVNYLIAINSFQRYLEVTTPVTGLKFAEVINRVAKHRIWSRATDSDDDGHLVTYRLHSDHAFADIHKDVKIYDISL